MKDLKAMPKKPPEKKPPKPKQNLSQKDKFLAYAKEVGVDESGEEFERALGKALHKEDSIRDSGK